MAVLSEDRETGGAAGRSRALAELLRTRPPMARPLPRFDPADAPLRPAELFVDWLLRAFADGVPDPQVVTFSTVDADGRPDARMLVLRDVDADRDAWWFAADADSPKGRQLAAAPWAALTAYWPAQGRQVRVRGRVETADPRLAAEEFLGRSPAARLAALVGRQSEPLTDTGELDEAREQAAAQLASDPEAVAPGHTLYALQAREAEFWQGDADRRHVRLSYTLGPDGVWQRSLLWP